jgi:hypothetical protein
MVKLTGLCAIVIGRDAPKETYKKLHASQSFYQSTVNLRCKVGGKKSLHVTFVTLVSESRVEKENALNSPLNQSSNVASREDFSEYVAHLQLHMALQARNLVPTLTKAGDSREQMLHQTQATFEKLVSRQAL